MASEPSHLSAKTLKWVDAYLKEIIKDCVALWLERQAKYEVRGQWHLKMVGAFASSRIEPDQ